MRPDLGLRVIVRDVVTLDELADLHAPALVEPGDMPAGELYLVHVVLMTPPGAAVVPVLARRIDSATV